MADPKALNLKTALILGISGQDGYFLAKLLLKNGYKVLGTTRHIDTTSPALKSLDQKNLSIIYADIRDTEGILNLITLKKPDEVYNLTGVSSVAYSFEHNEETLEANAYAVIRLFESLAQMGLHKIKFYQASSSEMFGKVQEVPQRENTLLWPRSPYGVAKVFGHYMTINYRESYNFHASSGILFNHESPRRGPEFVTRKVSQSVARIATGKQDKLVMGNLDAQRDWGFAGDYVKAMWLMLQQEVADDYVISTGKTNSVRELVELAFQIAGISDWEKYVEQSEEFMRPAEVDLLIGDPAKAKSVLGWETETTFEQLVTMMVENDLRIESNK